MLDFNSFEKILEEIEKEGLFNQFIINLLDYDVIDLYNSIFRYKIDNGLIIDIFDYKDSNKFIRYYFTDNFDQIKYNDNDNEVILKVINLNDYYNNFDKFNKFSLFSLLFKENDINIIEDNLSNLFNNKINNLILKHLKI